MSAGLAERIAANDMSQTGIHYLTRLLPENFAQHLLADLMARPSSERLLPELAAPAISALRAASKEKAEKLAATWQWINLKGSAASSGCSLKQERSTT